MVEMQSRISEDGRERNRREVDRKTAQPQEDHRSARQTQNSGRAQPDGEDRELDRGRHTDQITPARIVGIRKSCRNSDGGGYGETTQGASEIREMDRPSLDSGYEGSGCVGESHADGDCPRSPRDQPRVTAPQTETHGQNFRQERQKQRGHDDRYRIVIEDSGGEQNGPGGGRGDNGVTLNRQVSGNLQGWLRQTSSCHPPKPKPI